MRSLLECLVCRCKVCALDLRFTDDLGKVFNDHFTGDEHAANRAKIESLTKIYQPRMYSQVKYYESLEGGQCRGGGRISTT